MLLLSVTALLLVACDKTWIIIYDGGNSADPVMSESVLTPDGTDAYVIESTGVQVHTTALGTNKGGNLRMAFWPATAPDVTDSQSCATWTAQTERGNTQQGAALRISTAGGKTRALTVTKNIWYGATWIFNFHVWDTTKSPQFRQLGSVDFKEVVYGKPFPWHVCARVVGTSLQTKVWTGSEAEPVWGRNKNNGSVAVGSEWVYAGKAGWYIGHLPPGGYADFTNLKTWKYDVADTTTPDSTSSNGATATQDSSTDRLTVSAAP